MRRVMILLCFALMGATTLAHTSCTIPEYEFTDGTEGDEEVVIMLYKHNRSYFDDLENFVIETIMDVTDSVYWHTALIARGTRYECGYPNGVSSRAHNPPYFNNGGADYYTVRASSEQVDKMIAYAEELEARNVKYNVAKLGYLYLIHPRRDLWNSSPFPILFSDINKYGMICSVHTRSLLKAGGVDIMPNLRVSLTVPQDFYNVLETGGYYTDEGEFTPWYQIPHDGQY